MPENGVNSFNYVWGKLEKFNAPDLPVKPPYKSSAPGSADAWHAFRCEVMDYASDTSDADFEALGVDEKTLGKIKEHLDTWTNINKKEDYLAEQNALKLD